MDPRNPLDANSLGKGEVDSSILSGSTRNQPFSRTAPVADGRTEHESDTGGGGKAGENVPAPFRKRTIQQERTAKGLCPRCGEEAAPYYLCQKHRDIAKIARIMKRVEA